MEEYNGNSKKNLITFKRLIMLANTVVMDSDVIVENLILGYRLPKDNYERLYAEVCAINEVEYNKNSELPDDFEVSVGVILFKIELKK